VRPSNTVAQLANHVPQRQKTLVDVGGLVEAVAGGTRLAHPFGTGEVDKIELCNEDSRDIVFFVVVIVGIGARLDGHAKDSVGTT